MQLNIAFSSSGRCPLYSYSMTDIHISVKCSWILHSVQVDGAKPPYSWTSFQTKPPLPFLKPSQFKQNFFKTTWLNEVLIFEIFFMVAKSASTKSFIIAGDNVQSSSIPL